MPILAFGKVIKQAREERKLTQVDVAEQTGIDAAYISRIETDNQRNITIETLERIGRIVGLRLVLRKIRQSPIRLQDMSEWSELHNEFAAHEDHARGKGE